jgi:hypothetical protein
LDRLRSRSRDDREPQVPVASTCTDAPSVHPAVARLFSALDGAAIRWCLLRGVDELARPVGDVDVLVAADRTGDLEAVALTAGFARLPASGHGSHRFFVTYDAGSNLGMKADLVSGLAFGRFQELRTDTAPQVLARRMRCGQLSTLSPDDACWHFLLHCLLDKGEVRPQRRGELAERALAAAPAGPLATVVDTLRIPGLDAAALLAMTRAGRWEDLAGAAPRVHAGWAATHRLRARRVFLVNRVLRAASHRWPRPSTGLTVELAGGSAAVLAVAERLTATCPAPTRGVRYNQALGREVARAVTGRLRGWLVVLTGAPAGGRCVALARWPKRDLVAVVPNLGGTSSLEDVERAVAATVWNRWWASRQRSAVGRQATR